MDTLFDCAIPTYFVQDVVHNNIGAISAPHLRRHTLHCDDTNLKAYPAPALSGPPASLLWGNEVISPIAFTSFQVTLLEL